MLKKKLALALAAAMLVGLFAGCSSSGSGSSAGSSETPDESAEPEAPGADIDDGETPLSPTTFTDVPATYWAHDAIQYVVDEGLFSGTSGSTFTPGGTMTKMPDLV